MTDQTVDELHNSLNLTEIRKNTITVSNIVEVISSVVRNAAGNDISATIKEQNLTTNLLNVIIINKLNEKLLAQ